MTAFEIAVEKVSKKMESVIVDENVRYIFSVSMVSQMAKGVKWEAAFDVATKCVSKLL